MRKVITVIGAGMMLLSGAAAAYQDVTPTEAYNLATSDPNVYILDVRTDSEWTWVGHPGADKLGTGAALEGKVVNVSYKIDYKGSFVVNPSFLTEVREAFESNPNVVLITMCRSGKRSVSAAELLEANGYEAKNMLTGFEGGKDMYGYRTVNGWANDGLPYSYSSTGAYAD